MGNDIEESATIVDSVLKRLSLPVAHALVPLNPYKIPAHIAGS